MNTDKQCPAEAIPQGFFLPGNMQLPIPEKYGKISIGCGSERTAEKKFSEKMSKTGFHAHL